MNAKKASKAGCSKILFELPKGNIFQQSTVAGRKDSQRFKKKTHSPPCDQSWWEDRVREELGSGRFSRMQTSKVKSIEAKPSGTKGDFFSQNNSRHLPKSSYQKHSPPHCVIHMPSNFLRDRKPCMCNAPCFNVKSALSERSREGHGKKVFLPCACTSRVPTQPSLARDISIRNKPSNLLSCCV